MKKSIIYLGISFACFANAAAENTLRNQTFTTSILVVEQDKIFHSEIYNDKKRLAPVDEQIFFNPETVIFDFSRKTILEIISDNNKIIEDFPLNHEELLFVEKSIEQAIADDNEIIESENNTEIRPLYLEKTVEEVISENNAIIENSMRAEVYPLDFDRINKSQLYAEGKL